MNVMEFSQFQFPDKNHRISTDGGCLLRALMTKFIHPGKYFNNLNEYSLSISSIFSESFLIDLWFNLV